MTQKKLLTSFESSKLILDWSDGADFDICRTHLIRKIYRKDAQIYQWNWDKYDKGFRQ